MSRVLDLFPSPVGRGARGEGLVIALNPLPMGEGNTKIDYEDPTEKIGARALRRQGRYGKRRPDRFTRSVLSGACSRSNCGASQGTLQRNLQRRRGAIRIAKPGRVELSAARKSRRRWYAFADDRCAGKNFFHGTAANGNRPR